MEQHYLRNPDPVLSFALVTDFTDSLMENQSVDVDLVERARQGIRGLNVNIWMQGQIIPMKRASHSFKRALFQAMDFIFLFDAQLQALHSDKAIHLTQAGGTFTVLVVMCYASPQE